MYSTCTVSYVTVRYKCSRSKDRPLTSFFRGGRTLEHGNAINRGPDTIVNHHKITQTVHLNMNHIIPTAADTPESAIATPPSSPIHGDANPPTEFLFEDAEIDGCSEAEIIEVCKTISPLNKKMDHIFRVAQNRLVKCGRFQSLSEARNMEFVQENAPSVRLPRVFRVFQEVNEDCVYTYLVMEYIHGTLLSDCWGDMAEGFRENVVDQVVDIVTTLQSLHLDTPGPIGGGTMKDPAGLFPLSGINSKKTIGDLERWYDSVLEKCKKYRRVHPDAPSFEGAFGDTVRMSHLDIAPRNIVLQADGTICLLDWEFAGAYPSHFERYILMRQKNCDGDFNNRILAKIPDDPEMLKQQASIRWAISTFAFVDE